MPSPAPLPAIPKPKFFNRSRRRSGLEPIKKLSDITLAGQITLLQRTAAEEHWIWTSNDRRSSSLSNN